MQDSFDRCVSRNDPYEAILIANIVRQMVKMGVEDPLLTTFAEGSLLERCLRFELDFESKIVLEDKTPQGTATTRLKYRAATVPLRYSYAGNFYANRAVWEGGCSLVNEVASIEFPFPQGSRCVITIDDPGKGTFVSVATWIDILKNPMKSGVRVLYDPGLPTAKAFLKCPDNGPINFPVLQWAAEYYVLHGNEVARLQEGTGFMANGWQQLRFGPGPSQNGEFFAMKSYQRGPIPWGSTTSLTEETFFFLKHTPDKAMPDCSGGGAATPPSD